MIVHKEIKFLSTDKQPQKNGLSCTASVYNCVYLSFCHMIIKKPRLQIEKILFKDEVLSLAVPPWFPDLRRSAH